VALISMRFITSPSAAPPLLRRRGPAGRHPGAGCRPTRCRSSAFEPLARIAVGRRVRRRHGQRAPDRAALACACQPGGRRVSQAARAPRCIVGSGPAPQAAAARSRGRGAGVRADGAVDMRGAGVAGRGGASAAAGSAVLHRWVFGCLSKGRVRLRSSRPGRRGPSRLMGTARRPPGDRPCITWCSRPPWPGCVAPLGALWPRRLNSGKSST